MIRFASLGSGSAGNALLVESGKTTLMLDCGFGLRETVTRLLRVGRQPGDLDGIVVTHDLAAAGVAPGKHVEVWLVDSDAPAANAHLAWTLADAARTIAALREHGETVLLHCVHAQHRTPAVALAYSRLRGAAPGASRRVEDAVGHRVDGLLWHTARQGAR